MVCKDKAWSAQVSSPPVGGSVEGGRMLSSHSLSSRTLEEEPSASGGSGW